MFRCCLGAVLRNSRSVSRRCFVWVGSQVTVIVVAKVQVGCRSDKKCVVGVARSVVLRHCLGEQRVKDRLENAVRLSGEGNRRASWGRAGFEVVNFPRNLPSARPLVRAFYDPGAKRRNRPQGVGQRHTPPLSAQPPRECLAWRRADHESPSRPTSTTNPLS